MFLAIPIFILMAAAMAADWYHFHRFRRRRPIPAGRIVWAGVTGLLPLAALFLDLFCREDRCPAAGKVPLPCRRNA